MVWLRSQSALWGEASSSADDDDHAQLPRALEVEALLPRRGGDTFLIDFDASAFTPPLPGGVVVQGGACPGGDGRDGERIHAFSTNQLPGNTGCPVLPQPEVVIFGALAVGVTNNDEERVVDSLHLVD